MNPRVSRSGQLLGKVSAKLAEIGQPIVTSVVGDKPIPNVRDDVCASCACREGTVPNGCLQTQVDFLKCVLEPRPFLCHAPKNGQMCRGYIHARAGHVAAPIPQELADMLAEQPYSPPDEDEAP